MAKHRRGLIPISLPRLWRHEPIPTPSHPGSTHPQQKTQVSPEALQALRQAEQAQRDVRAKQAQLAPLMRQIRQHLAKNEIAETVAANFVRRTT